MQLLIAVLVAWSLGFALVALLLRRHLRNPHEKELGIFPRGIYIADLFKPDLFTDAGQRLRRLAIFWLVGGSIVSLVLYWITVA